MSSERVEVALAQLQSIDSRRGGMKMNAFKDSLRTWVLERLGITCYVLGLAFVLALLFAGTTVVHAEGASPAVPFKAVFSGDVILIDEANFELAGTGKTKAIHLGNVDYQAEGTFTGPLSNILIETLVAANGDTLVIECHQELEVVVPPFVLKGTDTWTVIDGTGRFSNATGTGTGETFVDLEFGSFTKVLTGEITY